MIRGLCFALLLAASSLAQANPEAIQWLERMVSSSQMLNYDGTFIYMHGKQLEAMSIVHRYDGDQEHERLLSLNGEAREVVRKGNNVTCIWPDSQKVMVDHGVKKTFPAKLPADLVALTPVYEFKMLGEARIAQRITQIVQIKPRDRYRYGFKLWLDKETALPLRSIRTDSVGQPIEQVMYTDFTLQPKAGLQKTLPRIMGKSYSWVINDDNNEMSSATTHWTFSQLPAGFTLKRVIMEQMPNVAEKVERLVFSDGLSTISVYIEKKQGKAPLSGGSKMGAMTAFGVNKEGYYITAVGEVPQITTRLLASALKLQ
ncbi:MAG: hypothetical protein HOM11_16025 [Methylococcales bacterium]|jgi:sigma-E factor negative regulatory protein RseB|nr:hypothetical protein [Methylococcales bacterium]MBT7444927.1 hypothetical protein [Methylococcales bacterium]